MKAYISIMVAICSLFASCIATSTEPADVQLQTLMAHPIGIRDYRQNDQYDTRVAISHSSLLVLNYQVAHADFYSSSANIRLLENGKTTLTRTLELQSAERVYLRIMDSLKLMNIPLANFVSFEDGQITSKDSALLNLYARDSSVYGMSGVQYQRNRIRKQEGTLIKLTYYDCGTLQLTLVDEESTAVCVLSSDLLPYSPAMGLYDITGDQKTELFVFYPCVDHWESSCYRLEIYDISDYL